MRQTGDKPCQSNARIEREVMPYFRDRFLHKGKTRGKLHLVEIGAKRYVTMCGLPRHFGAFYIRNAEGSPIVRLDQLTSENQQRICKTCMSMNAG